MKTFITFLALLSSLYSFNAQTQIGEIITGGDDYDGLDRSVAISDNGNRIILSAYLSDVNGQNDAGATLVYENVNNNWVQLGQALEGGSENEFMGLTVEISADGNRVATGIFQRGVQVYDLVNGQWEQVGEDITVPAISGTGDLEFSSNGEILAVGYNGFTVDKTVRVYKLINNVWTEMGDGFDGSQFGVFSLSNSGERIAVQFTTGNQDFDIGTFDFVNNSWTQVATLLESTSGNVLTEAFALSASGNRLVTTSTINNTTSGFVTTYDYQNNDWVETLPELTISIDNNFGVALEMAYNGGVFILGTANDFPITGISDVFVYQVINSQWELAGDVINGSASDEIANGHVDITGDGQKIVMAGNQTPDGEIVQFVASFDMSDVLSIDSEPLLNELQVFPNPTSGDITIELDTLYSKVELKLFNILGQVIQQKSLSNTQSFDYTIDGTSGIYLLQIITSEGTSKTIKVIKK